MMVAWSPACGIMCRTFKRLGHLGVIFFAYVCACMHLCVKLLMCKECLCMCLGQRITLDVIFRNGAHFL